MLISGLSELITPDGKLKISELFNSNSRKVDNVELCLLCSTKTSQLYYCVTAVSMKKLSEKSRVLSLNYGSSILIANIKGEDDPEIYIATSRGWSNYSHVTTKNTKNVLIVENNEVKESEINMEYSKELYKNGLFDISGLPIGCVISGFIVYPPKDPNDDYKILNGPINDIYDKNIMAKIKLIYGSKSRYNSIRYQTVDIESDVDEPEESGEVVDDSEVEESDEEFGRSYVSDRSHVSASDVEESDEEFGYSYASDQSHVSDSEVEEFSYGHGEATGSEVEEFSYGHGEATGSEVENEDDQSSSIYEESPKLIDLHDYHERSDDTEYQAKFQ